MTNEKGGVMEKTDLERILTIQKHLATVTIRNQKLESKLRKAVRLLERSMKFAYNVPNLSYEYKSFIKSRRS